MRLFIKKINAIACIITLTMISFNLFADVTLNDSAENLSGAKLTTLIPFNTPKTRPAYGYFQVGITGSPQYFVPNDDSLPDFTNFSNVNIGDRVYYVTVDIKYWVTVNGASNRVQKDVLLPKGNTYIIDRSWVGNYYQLKTEDIGSSSFAPNDAGDLSLIVFVQRYIVINHRCTDKDYPELKERCKGKKFVLTLSEIDEGFSIGEILSVLKPIISFDLNTIPKVVIPPNNK